MAYWDEETPIGIGSKFFSVNYYKNAGKMQIQTTSEDDNGNKTRKTVVLNKYVIDRLKEFFAKEVE